VAAEAHAIAGDPHLTRAGLVDLVRDPHEGQLRRRRIGAVRARRNAVVPTLAEEKDRRRRNEVTLLIRAGDSPRPRVDADDRLAQAVGVRADRSAVGGYFLDRPALTRARLEAGHDRGRRLRPEIERA